MYYAGRGLQIAGMWLLLVALFTAGPLGPSPRLFAAGMIAFWVGWLMARAKRGGARPSSGAAHDDRQQPDRPLDPGPAPRDRSS